MDVFDKLTILADAAKYDVACTSSGVDRKAEKGMLGSAYKAGICHSFAADGRCISLLKVLMSNACVYDCKYCLNRCSNDTPRASFSPRELADLTIHFYRRNYIEGLFLSSGVIKNPDYTTEQFIETLLILRNEYRFNGYIHVKAIPGADDALIQRLGLLADRMSVNIEFPSSESLTTLAPQKTKESILRPMGLITNNIKQNTTDVVRYNHAPKFVPAGQSTQMIVGATPESDYHILNLTQSLYKKYNLKRVFFSAYIPLMSDNLLPALTVKPPLLREHRLYQADWLLRFYGFDASEILDAEHPDFNPVLDPKCNWAINHMENFPIEVNKAPMDILLRVPGIGVKSAQRIVVARRTGRLDFDGLKRIGVVLKRAQYFITCSGKMAQGLKFCQDTVLRSLVSERDSAFLPENQIEQLSLITPDIARITREDVMQCLTGQI